MRASWRPSIEMSTRIYQTDNPEDLRDYVNLTLCEHCELQLGAFPLTERVLQRGGRPCGKYFCLHGPRATKFTAIWDMERNQLLFYGAGGERFLRVQVIFAGCSGRVAA